jgi:hypothetical protein
MAFLGSADLSIQDFLDTVKKTHWETHGILMAFTPSEYLFEKYVYDKNFLSQTEQGKIFSPDGELRWRKIESNVRVVYIGNSIPDKLEANKIDLSQKMKPAKRQLLLWGIRTNRENEWLEQKVPHRFDYPVDTAEFEKGRTALIIEDWIDSDGQRQFSRYHSIIEVKGDEPDAKR